MIKKQTSWNPLYPILLNQYKESSILVFYNSIDDFVVESENDNKDRHWANKRRYLNETYLYLCSGNKIIQKKFKDKKGKYLLFAKCHRKRLLDWDNFKLKSVIDGIRKMGIIPDDSPKYLLPSVLDQEVSKELKTEIHVFQI